MAVVSIEPLHRKISHLEGLRAAFGDRLQQDVALARYTTAHVGGPAETFLEVHSADELALAVSLLWESDLPYLVLGGGSNVLVSDRGVYGVVLLNRARKVRFAEKSQPPVVWAESGASFGLIARQAASRGLSGLEWAVGIPGSVGGAVFGNAGAHGVDIAGQLVVADILQRIRSGQEDMLNREEWPVERLEYSYRNSILKRNPGQAFVLAAMLRLTPSTPEEVQARTDEMTSYRRRTQPPGASLGSMFKNPPGDYAGRLIDAAGLKGTRIGDAQISALHANFFINHGRASAADIFSLIGLARQAVADQFGINLELEIELVGEW